MTTERVEEIKSILNETGDDAWLLYNFRETNTIASRIAGIPPGTHQTRRWALLIPAVGEPIGLVHRIEPHLGEYMPGPVIEYSSHEEFHQGLKEICSGHKSVAMEYSPHNAIPVVSRVDAGTIETIRALGVDVVSSGHLISLLEGRLTDVQIELAIRAGEMCRTIMIDAFTFIADSIRSHRPITEFDVVRQITAALKEHGLVTDHEPNCSVDENSANPHYQPIESTSRPITNDSFVLIDLWGKHDRHDGVYGDITWVGYVGTTVPDRYVKVFHIVREARDAAGEAVTKAFQTGESIRGSDLDRVARRIITDAGYGNSFIHRLGHSITTDLHGAGTNLDSFETIDDRPITDRSSFSIEPGIYLPGDFGVRLELDVVIDRNNVVVIPSEPLQHEIIPLLDPLWVTRINA